GRDAQLPRPSTAPSGPSCCRWGSRPPISRRHPLPLDPLVAPGAGAVCCRCTPRRSSRLFGLDHPAGLAGPGVAGRLSLHIVPQGMDDDRFADDGIVPGRQGKVREVDSEVRNTGLVRLDVAEIADVIIQGPRIAMVLVRRIEMWTCGGCVRRGAVALLMDMESVLTGGQAREIGNQVHAVLLRLESYLTLDSAPLGRLHIGNRGRDRRRGRRSSRFSRRLVPGMGVNE